MTLATRRQSLKMAALATLAAGCDRALPSPREPAGPTTSPSPPTPPLPPFSDDLLLWYRSPAQQWVEALPIGSGRLGAMVFGGVEAERLQLNEDTLWAGGPYDPTHPEALAALPEMRRLIFAGKYREAHTLAAAKAMARPLTQMPYQTAGDLALSFPGIASFDHYRRELRLDTAIARTTFTSAGAAFTREAFASPVDQVIVLRLTSDTPGRIDVDVTLTPPDGAKTEVEGDGTLVTRGKGRSEAGIEGALKYEVRAEVLAASGLRRGSMSPNRVSVRNADSVVILVSAATSYKSYRDVTGDPTSATATQIARARAKTFDALLADHVAEHRRLFGRVSIDLGRTDASRLPTDERARESAGVDDPPLAALYFQFGRYLLMSASRPGSQPANLQGRWNDSQTPPWGSKYTININTEMNYWPADRANLGECIEPLVAMVKDLAETGAHTAKVHYGARGWVTHHNTDLWRASAPIDGPTWGLWPTGGAWLCVSLWDHFDYSRDEAYLARIYPMMRGAAEFFLDTLVQEPKHGWLVTCPSLSPENEHPGGVSVCAGPTMDQQIIRDLFSHCIEAAEILGIDSPFLQAVHRARDNLAPSQVGREGQLQEWLEDWDMQAPEIHHRHVSHLYGLFPSSQITPEQTPELATAARKSLEIRGDEATGWGIAWRLNLWARLGRGDHAHGLLRTLVSPPRTYPNLFDSCPPFQIDGNFGGVSGICEMLLQSHSGVIHLLPALPKGWPSGSITGLRARGGFSVDMTWQRGQLEGARMSARPGARAVVRYRDQSLARVVPESGAFSVVVDGATLRAG
jgi:alpha-L-fucosidase 2